jgi:hypothetical protein
VLVIDSALELCEVDTALRCGRILDTQELDDFIRAGLCVDLGKVARPNLYESVLLKPILERKGDIPIAAHDSLLCTFTEFEDIHCDIR